ncbi:MAG: hypothetical protein F7B17_06975 [Desulfurococcales archaeon]|nr:hypothetical protein [Desulfurococcales archaeon]
MSQSGEPEEKKEREKREGDVREETWDWESPQPGKECGTPATKEKR